MLIAAPARFDVVVTFDGGFSECDGSGPSLPALGDWVKAVSNCFRRLPGKLSGLDQRHRVRRAQAHGTPLAAALPHEHPGLAATLADFEIQTSAVAIAPRLGCVFYLRRRELVDFSHGPSRSPPKPEIL